MKICTWNSRHGGKRTDDILDTAGFGQHLAAIDADVYCLQEVEQHDGYGNDDKVAKWCAALGPEWGGAFVNLSGILSGKGQGNAILYRTGALSSLAVGSLPMYGSRCAVAVQVAGVTIISTHLDNVKQQNRVVEMVQLFAWAKSLTDGKLVIAGDMNAVSTAPEMMAFPVLLKDAWKEADRVGQADSFKPGGITHGTSSRIDYVFYRGLTIEHVSVPNTSYGGTPVIVYPSDHYPVVATFA